MSAELLIILSLIGTIGLIDLVHVGKGNKVREGLFGLAIRGVTNIAILLLLMCALVMGVALGAVAGACVLAVLVVGWLHERIAAYWRRLDSSNWLLRRRARGKNAEDRLELANATAERRRPIYGREERLAEAGRRNMKTGRDGTIASGR